MTHDSPPSAVTPQPSHHRILLALLMYRGWRNAVDRQSPDWLQSLTEGLADEHLQALTQEDMRWIIGGRAGDERREDACVDDQHGARA